jgi:stalled ribosome rescue protein Dom34
MRRNMSDIMRATHACVWIDHREARIFGISREASQETIVHDHDAPRHIHHKADTIGSGNAKNGYAFFEEVASALGSFKGILIAGPGVARTEFSGYLAEHHPALGKRVLAIEPMDHPTEKQIVAAAHDFFFVDRRIR